MSNQSMSGGSGNRSGLIQELAQNAVLAWRLLLDPRVPLLTKMIPVGLLLYFLFPADVVPDVILGLGQLDDLAIILLGIRGFIAFCPPELVQAHRRGGKEPQPPPDDDKTVDGSYRVVDDQ